MEQILQGVEVESPHKACAFRNLLSPSQEDSGFEGKRLFVPHLFQAQATLQLLKHTHGYLSTSTDTVPHHEQAPASPYVQGYAKAVPNVSLSSHYNIDPSLFG